MRYAIVIEKAENNYAAYVPDLPGCVATGLTVEETEQQIREPRAGIVELRREQREEDAPEDSPDHTGTPESSGNIFRFVLSRASSAFCRPSAVSR